MWKSSIHAKTGTPSSRKYCATAVESVCYTKGDELHPKHRVDHTKYSPSQQKTEVLHGFCVLRDMVETA